MLRATISLKAGLKASKQIDGGTTKKTNLTNANTPGQRQVILKGVGFGEGQVNGFKRKKFS